RLEEGTARLVALRPVTSAEIRNLERFGGVVRGYSWYYVTLGQGMKRQIRRMFAAVEAPVRRLARIRIGTLRMGDMTLGDVRPLSAAERGQMERLVQGDGPAAPTQQRGLVVTIDGPGGSGKSTVGARAAEVLGYGFCDTGILYRGLTWLA